jgi:RNA polymerase sigma factor (sigma-70 family)
VARIVRDPEDAADVFQDVLVIVWHKLDRILCHPNPHGYILRICITRSYDALRKKMRRRRFEIRIETIKTKLWPKVSQQSPPAHNIANTIRAAISMLPPKQGQAVLLRAIEGSAYNAIADILGCGESTARSHFSKGKARLEKILQDLGI